jgi:hypothetical protein
MVTAQEIITGISDFLDRYSLKTSKLTNQDLIDFIETEWEKADNEKYSIHYGQIIIGRMINEYIRKKDFNNMMRWLKMDNLHNSSKEHPGYIVNYYNGQCCLECGNEEKALEYFNLCYNENPDYIYTRAPFRYEFYNKHIENPRELPRTEDIDDYLELTLELKYWQDFFNESDELTCELYDEDSEEIEELTENHKELLINIQKDQKEILTNILVELLKQYPDLQKKYNYSDKDKPEFMPDLISIDGFSDLLSPRTIYILEIENNQTYIGFLFSCSWDREHGLGIMTHNKQVKDIGGADIAFCI